MVSAMKQTTADDGVTIAYTVFDGVEPAVVLLHGLAGSGSSSSISEAMDTARPSRQTPLARRTCPMS
jgi:predicted alpha/beta-fold hydrolase